MQQLAWTVSWQLNLLVVMLNHLQYKFAVSVFEVYNDECYDLLDEEKRDEKKRRKLGVKVGSGHVVIEGLISRDVGSVGDVSLAAPLLQDCSSCFPSGATFAGRG